MTFFWLSFCDPKKPDDGFLGACVVEADSFPAAVKKAWRLGINPGGEVLAFDVTPFDGYRLNDRWLNRLLNREECETFDADPKAAIPIKAPS
jgi:hypothetical protein